MTSTSEGNGEAADARGTSRQRGVAGDSNLGR
jgi:hypothetical protein